MARLRVLVSDGVHVAMDTSDQFLVDNNAPTVARMPVTQRSVPEDRF